MSEQPERKNERTEFAKTDEQKMLSDDATDAALVSSAAHKHIRPGEQATAAGGSEKRYRILRAHAKGGLGEVYVAEDLELHRQVALKEIQARYADDAVSRNRFILEAEITGNLEHPGIVPVYGLGRYGDGRPFYSMRFIQGESLKASIERFHTDGPDVDSPEQKPSQRQLLRRFVDVCNAVAYAHSRGVLHRDLKPPNIMLGKYGETLVVDWGLAKMLNRPDAASDSNEVQLAPHSAGGAAITEMGSTLGTPAYMSPEQASGRLNQVGPASDVYSLGATLFALLTGQPPFVGRDRGEILEKVCRGDFPTPQQLNSLTPKALSAICLRAMALEPEMRYATPLELASDVEHWLADEPVSAYSEPLTVRAGRWARRHKPLVASVAALLVMSVVALGLGTILLGHANARTEVQRDLAQKHFHKARQVVDYYLTTISESKLLASPVPGLQPLRKELLEAALKYYLEFLEQPGDDPTLPADLAAAYFRVADITDAIGEKEEALKYFVQARDRYRELAQANRSEPNDQADYAKSQRRLADLEAQTGRQADALASYQLAIELWKTLLADHITRSEYRSELARAFSQLGLRYQLNAQPDIQKALEAYQQAILIGEVLISSNPDSVPFQSHLSESYGHVSYLYRMLGLRSEAANSSQRGLAIAKKLAQDHPERPEFQGDLARSHFEVAELQRLEEHWDDAVDTFEQNLLIWRQLARDNPAVTDYQLELARAAGTISNLQCDMDRLDDALETGQESSKVLEKIAAQNPSNERFQFFLGLSYHGIGKIKRKQGTASEALDYLNKGAAVFEKLSEDPMDSNYNLGCALALCSSVAAQVRPMPTQDDEEQAAQYALRAIEALHRAVATGFRDVNQLKQDPDFEPLRPRADFRKLIDDLERLNKSEEASKQK